MIPAQIKDSIEFLEWHESQIKQGNKLLHADLVWSHGNFAWIMKVSMYVGSEDRVKDNEYIFSRTNIACILLYKRERDILDSKIVLVSEYRSPCRNDISKVVELPGGTGYYMDGALKELYEETGFTIDSRRVTSHGFRQQMSTLLVSGAHLFSAELTEEEVYTLEMKHRSGEVLGNAEEGERTSIVVMTLSEILNTNIVDWSNIGMITSVLLNNTLPE